MTSLTTFTRIREIISGTGDTTPADWLTERREISTLYNRVRPHIFAIVAARERLRSFEQHFDVLYGRHGHEDRDDRAADVLIDIDAIVRHLPSIPAE